MNNVTAYKAHSKPIKQTKYTNKLVRTWMGVWMGGGGGCGNCAKDGFDNHEPSPDDPDPLMVPFICLMMVTMVSISVTRGRG